MSVKKNKGYYVGRYETSLTSDLSAQSMREAVSATGSKESADTWYGFYQKQKEYSENNNLTNIIGSSMMWGCQYDQMLIWMKDNNINVEDSVPIAGASANKGNMSQPGTTGTYNADKLNNIYDLLGNGYEWTLEAEQTDRRSIRRRILFWGRCTIL